MAAGRKNTLLKEPDSTGVFLFCDTKISLMGKVMPLFLLVHAAVSFGEQFFSIGAILGIHGIPHAQ